MVNKKTNIKKILTGAALVASTLVGGTKSAKAQVEPDSQDSIAKSERLSEIKISLDSIDKVISEKKEHYDLISDFLNERVSFEKYSNTEWILPSGLYIKDEILKNIADLRKNSQDSEVLLNEEKIMRDFFSHQYNESVVNLTGISLASAEDFFIRNLTRMVREEIISADVAKIITRYLSPYSSMTFQKAASKYDVLIAEFAAMRYQDMMNLNTKYKVGEISPQEYTQQQNKLHKIYELLARLVTALNKNKQLSGATNIYKACMLIKDFAKKSLRASEYKKTDLQEEMDAIMMPPVSQEQAPDAVNKIKSRSAR